MNARDKDFDGSARVGADLVDVTAYYGKLKLLFGLVGTAALLTFAYQYWADPDWLLKSTMYGDSTSKGFQICRRCISKRLCSSVKKKPLAFTGNALPSILPSTR